MDNLENELDQQFKKEFENKCDLHLFPDFNMNINSYQELSAKNKKCLVKNNDKLSQNKENIVAFYYPNDTKKFEGTVINAQR